MTVVYEDFYLRENQVRGVRCERSVRVFPWETEDCQPHELFTAECMRNSLL